MIYLLIFSFKIIENTLSTIRIIILANNNKKLAAILQGIISLIWVISTSLVVIDFNKGIGKIIAFTFGSLIGSYLGSILEEKIAIGNILLTIKIRKEKTKKVLNILKLYNTFTIKNDNYNILLCLVKRKRQTKIIKQIKKADASALIIYEQVSYN